MKDSTRKLVRRFKTINTPKGKPGSTFANQRAMMARRFKKQRASK